MSFVTKLKCARCGREHPPETKICMCPSNDDGRLDIYYDYPTLIEKVTKKTLAGRLPGVWKYRELLPIQDKRSIVTLGEGGTPLIKAASLAQKIGLRSLFLKDETRNPTGSFKDRSMTVGASKALEFDARVVAIASSGNAAASLAAYSAKAGLKCYAFVLESAPIAKIAQIRLYGAEVVRVKEVQKGVDPTVQMLRMVVKRYGWYPCPSFGSFNPYQVEGCKTLSFEITEQLNWNTPDWVVIPVGSACLFTGVWKGFRDYCSLDLVSTIPKLAAVQATGCAPLVRAFGQGKCSFEIESWEHPDTVAGGLADVYPWDGDAALSALKETGGSAKAVSDRAILEAQKLLASTEGIFAEPSGVASLAGLIELVDEGVVDADERVVVLITGSGLKDPQVVVRRFKEVPIIKPSIEEFEKSIKIAGAS